MKTRKNYRKPGLRTFLANDIREEASMAFLQAGSPVENGPLTECCPPRLPSDECPSTALDVPEAV